MTLSKMQPTLSASAAAFVNEYQLQRLVEDLRLPAAAVRWPQQILARWLSTQLSVCILLGTVSLHNPLSNLGVDQDLAPLLAQGELT